MSSSPSCPNFWSIFRERGYIPFLNLNDRCNNTAGIASISAFSGGLVPFFSPCTLPLLPDYLLFIAGNAQSDKQPQVMISNH
uniref:cytochrome c biogenesis protein CcdA n=1 Tax=Photobacterium frigidiphilum TaxID=264736 RepID=UPI003899D8B9